MARTGKPAVRQVGSVQRAIAVLNVLGEAHGELGTNEIARRTGLNVSTVSRLLATLVDGGLVRHIPATGRYRLGIRILQLASVARENLDIPVLARPYLEELSQLTGETATLSMPGEHDVLTVDFAQSDSSVRSVAAIGRNSVAHATAVSSPVPMGAGCPTARGVPWGSPRTRAALEELGCPDSPQPDTATAAAARRMARPPLRRRTRQCRDTEHGSTAR